ncbi:expressed unknown protein [Seminavis robusta]|uniref:Uncharacterized protein n=1 Tax=Seminavis robusta TaxID=568900 RepID=A0A9N8EKD7_9STRA|nr:expressed unknown protein [Seminavis robusta]|eukprot:Sro1071_g237910.1 n/a (126) ;mRNA; f:15275-15652
MFGSKQQQQQQQSWTIAHLATEEPEAAAYLDDWDDSTLASTLSLQRDSCCGTTILRNAGEPSTIIISREKEQKQLRFLAGPGKAMEKLLRLIRLIFKRLALERKSSAMSMASSYQPSLGVNGVMV